MCSYCDSLYHSVLRGVSFQLYGQWSTLQSVYVKFTFFYSVIFIAELLVGHVIEPARTKICLSFSFSSGTLVTVKYGPSPLTWLIGQCFPNDWRRQRLGEPQSCPRTVAVTLGHLLPRYLNICLLLLPRVFTHSLLQRLLHSLCLHPHPESSLGGDL